MLHGTTIAKIYLGEAQKMAFLSQNRKLEKDKKGRKERKDAMAQRELGYRVCTVRTGDDAGGAGGSRSQAETIPHACWINFCQMPDATAMPTHLHRDLSASASESLRLRDDPIKNKGPVTEVTRPFGSPVSVTSTAGSATFLTRLGNNGSKKESTLP